VQKVSLLSVDVANDEEGVCGDGPNVFSKKNPRAARSRWNTVGDPDDGYGLLKNSAIPRL